MITVGGGKFIFNGAPQARIIGRSSFKLSNIVTHHFKGQGSGKYSLGYARRWVEHNQRIFGENVVLRVFLETAGWSPCDDANGVPENCMFGSEPRDQGFWNRQQLRDGNRETEVHATGRKVLDWFFKTSQETGCALELVIDATLKHDDIPEGEIDHVIRQVGLEMGRLSEKYPTSLVIPSMCNEWNAHSKHTLQGVNNWAIRWDRDDYWPGAAKIVDPRGGNVFTYEVGPEPGKYRAGCIHPSRGSNWASFPSPSQLNRLRTDARGMPVAFTESMYYVELEDRARAEQWYRPSGWTSNFDEYRSFMEHAIPLVEYFVIHDEKGVQCDPAWPRAETRVEAWAREFFGTGNGDDPPPPPQQFRYEPIIALAYTDILGRKPDRGGLESYNVAMASGMTEAQMRETLIRSQEYDDKNGG